VTLTRVVLDYLRNTLLNMDLELGLGLGLDC
jgi:hypothetical protein